MLSFHAYLERCKGLIQISAAASSKHLPFGFVQPDEHSISGTCHELRYPLQTPEAFWHSLYDQWLLRKEMASYHQRPFDL